MTKKTTTTFLFVQQREESNINDARPIATFRPTGVNNFFVVLGAHEKPEGKQHPSTPVEGVASLKKEMSHLDLNEAKEDETKGCFAWLTCRK